MRFTVDLGKLHDSKLSELSEREGTTKAEILKRAIALYAFMRDKVDKEDQEIYFKDKSTGKDCTFLL
jgi:hypothetical protein